MYLVVFDTWCYRLVQSLYELTSSCCVLFQVPKLIEGREYIIRIMAQNMYGISDPLLSAETKARDIFSKS